MTSPEYPEGTVVRVEDMGLVERAYAEAMHEDCEDGPPHPLEHHSPWSGGDLDGVEPWPTFMARLARHGLTLTLARSTPDPAGAGLRRALEEAHDAVCICPFDGSDDGCNLFLSGANLGRLIHAAALAQSSDPAGAGQ